MDRDALIEGQRNLERRRAQEAPSLSEPCGDGWPKGRKRPQLSPIECPDCGGNAAEDEEGRQYCTDCAQAAEWRRFFNGLRHDRLKRAGLFEEPLSGYTMDSFETPTDTQRRAKQTIKDWLFGWPYHRSESVLLWSAGYGVGKTHLIHAVQRLLLNRGVTVTFYLLADMLSFIRASYNKDEDYEFRVPTENAIIATARRAQVLILDDLGKIHVTTRGRSWSDDLMFRIIDHRYRFGRSMLITSNDPPDRLRESVGGAAASRLYRMLGTRIVDMSGPDWRMR